jgi:hypothetical protein
MGFYLCNPKQSSAFATLASCRLLKGQGLRGNLAKRARVDAGHGWFRYRYLRECGCLDVDKHQWGGGGAFKTQMVDLRWRCGISGTIGPVHNYRSAGPGLDLDEGAPQKVGPNSRGKTSLASPRDRDVTAAAGLT